MSAPDSIYYALLTRKTPQGEFWYVFDHGSGNSESTGSYTLTTVQIAPLAQVVQAKAMAAPLNPKDHACQDPPWLARPFPNFKISSCEKKAWDVTSVGLAQGSQDVQGARVTVNYDVTDIRQTPVALAVIKNYMNALAAIGAKLESDPHSPYHAVWDQKTPVGEFWYVYNHGSGNADATNGYNLTTIQITPFPQEVQARPMQGPLAPKDKACANPPWLVKQFSYFKLDTCSYRDFDQVSVDLPGGARNLAGHVLVSDFTLTDPVQDPAAQTVKTNYVNALRAIGAAEASDPKVPYNAAMTQKTAQGEFWYLLKHTSGNSDSTESYELTTVQIGGPTPKACTLEIYGVNFDFNKAALRADSEPVLAQVLGLFNGDPAFAAEVGGHTDNVGQGPYNLKLSAARANAVKAWLVAHGVAPGRVTAAGYGDTRPLVPNTTDDNRAKNRRVELKRPNCKV
jgi:outer membrane protein OmpA-like peptidoglycan-associated protein